MRAVVTRPVEDAERIAAPLRERGVDVLVEPLLAVVTAAAADVSIDGLQGFLLTSANGARALAAALKDTPHGLRLPALCVGDQTMRVARELGFVTVLSADGDVDSLAALVRRRLHPSNGALLHAAGGVVAGDLQERLEADGFEVRRKVLYDTRTAKRFSEEFRTALRDGVVDCVLLYSPRTARTFLDLATQDDLRDACRDLTAYCLSQAVADALGDPPFHRVRVAPEPNQEALLSVFDEDNAYAFASVPSQTGDEDPQGDGTMTERPKAGKTGDAPETETDETAKAVPPSGTDAPVGKDAKDVKDAKAPKDAATPSAAPGKADPKDKPDSKDKADPKDKAATKAAPTATPKSAGTTQPSAAATTPKGGATPGASATATPKAGGPTASSAAAKPASAPAGSSGGVSGGIVAVLVSLVVLLGLWATLPIWRGHLPPALQEATAAMVPGADGADTKVLEADIAALGERVAALTTTMGDLQERVAALETAPVAEADGSLSDEARRTIEDLRGRVAALADAQPPDLEQDIVALRERVQEMQASRAEASTVLNLTDRVARVEEAVRHQEARQASAVAFLVTVGQLRAAVDAGRPFDAELRSARALAPQDVAMDSLTEGWAAMAGRGVPTLTALRQVFADRSDAILRASVALDETAGWWDRTVDRALSVVSIRRTDGDAVGDGAAAVVSRAEQDLKAGDLAAAAAEVETLDGAAAEAAADWLAAARARLAADTALGDLTGEALARLQAVQTGGAEPSATDIPATETPATATGAAGQEG